MQRNSHMNWRIRLTWWDKTLLVIMAVAGIIGFFRFATGSHRRRYQQCLSLGMVGRLRHHDDDCHRWRRLHDHGVSGDLWCAPLPFFRAPRGSHGIPLLRQRNYDADGGAWPAVDGLDGPGLLGADVGVVRSRLVRIFVSHCARFGIRAGAARGGRLASGVSCCKRDLYSDHASRRDAVAFAPVLPWHSDDAHSSQGASIMVVG